MPFSTAALNASAAGITAAGRFVSAHSADPGATGTSEIAGATRQGTTWGTATNGTVAGSQVAVPIPAGSSVTHWGIWSAVTGGTFLGGWALGATETFGAAGTLNHTPTVTSTNSP